MISIPKWGAPPLVTCYSCGRSFTLNLVTAHGEAGSVLCPHCGASNYKAAEPSRLAQVAIVLALVLIGIWLISRLI